MKKKIIALTLTAVMLCFVLSGCSETETYSSWMENVHSVLLTEDVTAAATGFGVDENTYYVNVAFTNTASEDLGIMVEKVVLNAEDEIEIGTGLIAIAGGVTESTVTFTIDMPADEITAADIYVVINGETAVYHLDVE